MVCAIRIHDRQPLDSLILRPAFGDIGNAAIEKGQFARQPCIDCIGAFMRRPAPIARRHIKAKPRGFIAETNVIEITANGQIAIAAHADKALHQLFDRTRFPIFKLR